MGRESRAKAAAAKVLTEADFYRVRYALAEQQLAVEKANAMVSGATAALSAAMTAAGLDPKLRYSLEPKTFTATPA